jgi:hypothetical protein
MDCPIKRHTCGGELLPSFTEFWWEWLDEFIG